MIILIMFGVSIITFSLTSFIPGDVVDILLDMEYDPEVAAHLRESIGLDKPFWVRYSKWIFGVLQGDLGLSVVNGRPIFTMIIEKYPPTLEIAFFSTLLGLIVGIPLGVYSGIKQFKVADDVIRFSSLIGFSLPSFWIGTLMLLFLSLYVPEFPILRYIPFKENPLLHFQIIMLPSITLGVAMSALIIRMTRACVLDQIRQDYVINARARGLSESVILFKHVLRNAILPVITLVGIRFGYLIGGLVIIEEVFGIPGLGRMVIFSIYKRDYPLVLGLVLFFSLSFTFINLIVDLLYAWIDPRISYGNKSD
jgi:peptide/nickel transport system permease protein